MENNRIDSAVKNLVIGDCVISCYGSHVGLKAELPFSAMAFYQPGAVQPDMCLKLNKVEPDDSGELVFGSADFAFPTFLYRRASGCYDWLTRRADGSPVISFRISSDWTEFTLFDDYTDTNGERAFHEFGSLFSYAVLNHHACVLHGVVMEYEGRGILVTAAAGTGKTTHTRMWRDNKNALILNGDRCLCRKVDGVWYAYGMPWSGSSGEYINRRVPIFCIVNLKRGSNNYVRPMTVFDSTICLMQRIFAPVWPGELQNKGFDCCQELAAEIPMLDFFCRPDMESVEVLAQALEEL